MRWGRGGPSVTRGDQILLEQTVRGDHLSRGTINFMTDQLPLQYGLTVPGLVTPCLCNSLLFLSTTEKGALLLCSTLLSPKNQGSQTGRSIRKRKSHCKPMPNYALKPASCPHDGPHLILVCSCKLGGVMARHCLFSDHCQRDNIAHLWKLLHTFGSNTAHLPQYSTLAHSMENKAHFSPLILSGFIQ